MIFTHQTKACQLHKARAVKKSETIMWMATLTPIWLLNPNPIHSLFRTGIQGWFGFNWFAVESKDDQLLKVETTTKPANVNIITKTKRNIFNLISFRAQYALKLLPTFNKIVAPLLHNQPRTNWQHHNLKNKQKCL